MSLDLAIARGALDIAHGFYVGVKDWAGRLWDRVSESLGVRLNNFDLTELIGLTESSRDAALDLWSGGVSQNNVPLADPPYMGSVTGGQFDNYQIKIINHANSESGLGASKDAFYLEFPDVPDKVGIEEYIRKFWNRLRELGHDTSGVSFPDLGTMVNVPIYLVRRKSCPSVATVGTN